MRDAAGQDVGSKSLAEFQIRAGIVSFCVAQEEQKCCLLSATP